MTNVTNTEVTKSMHSTVEMIANQKACHFSDPADKQINGAKHDYVLHNIISLLPLKTLSHSVKAISFSSIVIFPVQLLHFLEKE